ncbi:MAG TPA: PEP-CTERM sorting domain-containing protein [Tepidisphaeraceae bacterium]|jgi:hypothetical protein
MQARILTLSAAMAVSMMSVPASAVLLNTSFENGAGTDADNFNEIEASGDTANTNPQADRVNSDARTGSFSLRLSYANTATVGVGSNAEIQQLTSPPGLVNPGDTFNFSFFAKRAGDLGPGTVGFYRVQFLDSDGSAGGGVKGDTGLQQYQNGLQDGTYTQFTLNNIIAPAGADAALISIQLSGGAVANASATVFIDDVTLTTVPEPTAALALAGVGAMALRRKRK